MDEALQIDLTVMPTGKRYEDRYGKYLEFFHMIATTPAEKEIEVINPPASWTPLLCYLNCTISLPTQNYFEHDKIVNDLFTERCYPLDRTTTEVLCGFRPECVDALWKIDMQWKVPPGRVQASENKKEFIVTCNGSFYRPEVLDYLKQLNHFVPPSRKVVLVPCAADKPYPSPLHQAVLDRMPADFYLANVTGVLGIVPQAAWPTMPHYDSGVPEPWRLMNILIEYFGKFEHTHVVAYIDFYSLAVKQAFLNLGQLERVTFVNECKFYADYVDLLSPERLRLLEKVFGKEREKEKIA